MKALLVAATAALFISDVACAPIHRSSLDQSSIAKTGRNADLDVVERDFLAVDASYSAEERARATAMLARLRSDASTLSDAAFELSLAELARIADNGHTVVQAAAWPARYNKIPLTFVVFDDGLYVAAAQEPYSEAVGSRVEAIEGLDLDELRLRWSRYQAATPGFRDEYLPLFLESPEILHAAGIARSRTSINIKLERHGRLEGHRIIARRPNGAASTLFTPRSRLLSLTDSIPDGDKPLYLRSSGALFQLVALPERDTYYLQFRANTGQTQGMSVQEFAAHALAVLRQARPRHIILDERLNPGGSLSATRDLMQALPDIIGGNGRLFILISGRTFSAGIASVAYAKQAAGPRATLIGSSVGDVLEFWAEGSPITLPFSGIIIQPSPKRHNYMTGCPEADCHLSIQRNPIRIASLDPDVRIGLTYADFVTARDPLLDAALRLIERG